MAWTTPRTWVSGELVTAALMNSAVRDNLNILKTAINDSGQIEFTDATELTIASGVITVTQNYHKIDTESAASTDDLDTITAGSNVAAGFVLHLRAESAARTVVIKNGTSGSDNLDIGGDVTLDESYKTYSLVYDGSNWRPWTFVAADTFAGLSPLTTRGDVLYSSSGTVTGTRLAVGAAGTRLGTDGTDVSWVSPTATILQKTAAYTCTVADCGFDALIKCHMTGGAAAFAIDLYAASGNAGRRIAVLKETDDNHIVTVDPNGSDTIANAPGQTGGYKLFALGDYVVLTCDGTNWFVESEHQSIHGLVRLNANQTVATGAYRRVNYDTTVYDTFGGWNTAGNYEFTVPRYGYYQISAAAYIDGPNDTSCMTQIKVSNAEVRLNRFQNMAGGNLPVGVTLQIDTNAYVQIFSQHNRGSNTELVAGLANTYFSIDYIGQ